MPRSGAYPQSPQSVFFIPAMFALLGYMMVFLPIYASSNDVPGNHGDATLNTYLLEHVYKWLSGQTPSLGSLRAFFPFPDTFGFSDTHAGSALVYAGFRRLGLDPFDAFKGWIAVGYLGTLFAAYFVLRRLGISQWAAGAGAFLFAFSLPAIEKLGHAQLSYRWAVPFSFLYAIEIVETMSGRALLKYIVATCAGLLFSVYLGMFALMHTGALIFVLLVMKMRATSEPLPVQVAIWWSSLRRGGWPIWLLLLAIASVLATMVVLGFHMTTAREYGLSRSWGEIRSMLPRPQSYLMLDSLRYWAPVSLSLPPVPVRHESSLFLGFATLLPLALAIALTAWRPQWITTGQRQLFWALGIAFLIIFAVTIVVGPWPLYKLLAKLPGLNSIRAVARHIVVGAFPIVLMIAIFHDHYWRQSRRPAGAALILAAAVSMHAFDLSQMNKYSYSSANTEAQIKGLVAKLRGGNTDLTEKVLVNFGMNQPHFQVNLEAMMVASELGMTTLNGYSGHTVPGQSYMVSCAMFNRQLVAYRDWAAARQRPSLAEVWRDPVVLGETCIIDRTTLLEATVTAGPGLEIEEARNVRLAVIRTDLVANGRVYHVRISNDGKRPMHALSENPLRLTWLEAETAQLGWRTREDIPYDIAPGGHVDVAVTVRPPSGTPPKSVSISFAVEGRYFGHNVGIPPVTVDDAAAIGGR